MAQTNKQDTQRRIIEQDRAQQAWDAIEKVRPPKKRDDETKQESDDREKKEKRAGKYGSRAKNLPSMIQVNGLAATLAFLRAKASNEQDSHDYLLYQHISKRVLTYLEENDVNDLLAFIRKPETDTDTYRRATTESITFAIWLKRYCEAEGWDAKDV